MTDKMEIDNPSEAKPEPMDSDLVDNSESHATEEMNGGSGNHSDEKGDVVEEENKKEEVEGGRGEVDEVLQEGVEEGGVVEAPDKKEEVEAQHEKEEVEAQDKKEEVEAQDEKEVVEAQDEKEVVEAQEEKEEIEAQDKKEEVVEAQDKKEVVEAQEEKEEIEAQDKKEEVEAQEEKEEEGGTKQSDEDEKENNVQLRLTDTSSEGKEEATHEKDCDSDRTCSVDEVENNKQVHQGTFENRQLDGGRSEEVDLAEVGEESHVDSLVTVASVQRSTETNQKPSENGDEGSLRPDIEDDNGFKSNAYDPAEHPCADNESKSNSHGVIVHDTPSPPLKLEHMKEEEPEAEAKTKMVTMVVQSRKPSNYSVFDIDTSGGGESGTEDEQGAFIRELVKFHKQKGVDFKAPKFYGEPLNLLKLWRSVLKLGGYDKATSCKYWRQVGESFNPPKTCTTISWTFRIFYEKALLEYERYRMSEDSLLLPGLSGGSENQASGSGRARRDAAARAMQGWHSQRTLDNGEVSDPIVKDKNLVPPSKKEKQLKNLGTLKRKQPSSMDTSMNVVRAKVSKSQSETTVIDIGSPADWVKINVRVTKDCYEVYALVPGLLREEVRVQSDPAGRLVISGEPENPDNPWNVTPFKKVVSLPSRIDPHQTSAVVTLHGQLFVRVPFEQLD